MEQVVEKGFSFGKPIFCGCCRCNDTWFREVKRDIFSEDSKILYIAWKCGRCGAKTITEKSY